MTIAVTVLITTLIIINLYYIYKSVWECEDEYAGAAFGMTLSNVVWIIIYIIWVSNGHLIILSAAQNGVLTP